jgi:hypothetical protein
MSAFRRDLFQISESSYSNTAPEVDGEYIIGKLSGESFFLDGFSRNKRFYPGELWEMVSADPAIRQRLVDRNMFGSIGHDVKLDDEAFRKGDFTHIVSDIRITEEGKGVVDYLILNTDAGRNLNTILRAGSKVYVSSRADGDFVEGQMNNGMPIVDPHKYRLETFDFVLDPGFLGASPELVESYNELFPTNKLPENSDMADKDILQALTEKQSEVTDLTLKITESIRANEELNTKLALLESENSTLHANEQALREKLTIKESVLTGLNKLGGTKAIKTVYELLGEITGLIPNYDPKKDILEQLKPVFAASRVNSRLVNVLEKKGFYDKGDTALAAVLNMATVVESAGAFVSTLKRSRVMGRNESLVDLAPKVIKVTSIAESAVADKKEARIKTLSAELKVPEAKIRLISDKSDKEIREVYGAIAPIVQARVKYDRYKREAAKPEPKAGGRKLGESFPSASEELASKFGFE